MGFVEGKAMIDEIFRYYAVNFNRLEKFGFKKEGNNYVYKTLILDGSFEMLIYVSLDGKVKTKVLDSVSGEEYILHLVGGIGEFVGKVRLEFEKILTEVRDSCFDRSVHSSPQTKRVIEFIGEKFNGKLEYLWEKYPTDAIWRRSDNKKWYGLVMTIPKNKLNFETDELVEVMDVRAKPEFIDNVVDGKLFFRGYHMNKTHWLTFILDDSVEDSKIFSLIEESYNLAKK